MLGIDQLKLLLERSSDNNDESVPHDVGNDPSSELLWKLRICGIVQADHDAGSQPSKLLSDTSKYNISTILLHDRGNCPVRELFEA